MFLPERQAGLVRSDPPDEDAYGRVTNPERFLDVADAATALVGELVDTFDVETAAGISALDDPNWPDESAETIRLEPVVGTPLAILITDFPGVLVRFGAWGRKAFPECGCDACDEQPPEVIESMHQLVEAAVAGRYEEALTKRALSYSFTGAWGRLSSQGRLKRNQWKHHGEPGAHSWPPCARAGAAQDRPRHGWQTRVCCKGRGGESGSLSPLEGSSTRRYGRGCEEAPMIEVEQKPSAEQRGVPRGWKWLALALIVILAVAGIALAFILSSDNGEVEGPGPQGPIGPQRDVGPQDDVGPQGGVGPQGDLGP